MKILYLTEDYIHTQVHHNLCNQLYQNGYEITVFSVLRNRGQSKDLRNSFGKLNYNAVVTPLNCSELLYKYIFHYKINKKYTRLLSNVTIDEFSICHASTLFTEGALALKLNEKFGLPYIVVVRGTDVNFYLKKMPFLWPLARKIISNAKKIVFLTNNLYFQTINSVALSNLKNLNKDNCIILPNGVTFKELKNKSLKSFNHKLLFIGRFDKNKNVTRLIKAFKIIQKSYSNVTLNLVGGGGNDHNKILKIIENDTTINYHGEVRESQKLSQIFNDNDIFIMISLKESFGIVYIEALTHGLPIIYSKNQGFDGFFEDGRVGYRTDPKDIKDICYKIELAIINYSNLTSNINTTSFDIFSWPTIAKSYANIYNEILN